MATAVFRYRVTYVERPRYPALVGTFFELDSRELQSAEDLRRMWHSRRDHSPSARPSIRVDNIEGGVRITQLAGDNKGEVRDVVAVPEVKPPTT